ncbi:MAG: efflux RND transporter periplasmic adaptor subunit, partial [Pirellulales bacterium]
MTSPNHHCTSIRATALVALILAAVPIPGCAPKAEIPPPPPVPVTIAQPLQSDVTRYLEETGTTVAVAKVEVRARVSGVLEEVKFEPGVEVEAGDVLYVIQQSEYIAIRDAAQASVDAANVVLETAKIEYDRQLRLQKDNATSDVEVVAAKAAQDGALASLDAAKARLDQAQLNLDYTEVKAPISGRVGKTLVDKGNLVGNGEATHLTTIISYDPIYANFNISERDLLSLRDSERSNERREEQRPQKTFWLQRDNDTGFPFQGSFNYADLAVDNSTGNYLVRGIFPNADRKLVPGLFVRIRSPIETIKDALLVPDWAVFADQAGKYVLVANPDNVVERRDVRLGIKADDMQVS